MSDGDYINFGICAICKIKEPLPLDDVGICEECNRKLDKQLETGRCGWCGRLVMECVCDDDNFAW